ncbi:MAG TPA: hypothetical protein VGP72_16625 [Planctomycetota bacterium]|jgi:hypothetical protein
MSNPNGLEKLENIQEPLGKCIADAVRGVAEFDGQVADGTYCQEQQRLQLLALAALHAIDDIVPDAIGPEHEDLILDLLYQIQLQVLRHDQRLRALGLEHLRSKINSREGMEE